MLEEWDNINKILQKIISHPHIRISERTWQTTRLHKKKKKKKKNMYKIQYGDQSSCNLKKKMKNFFNGTESAIYF